MEIISHLQRRMHGIYSSPTLSRLSQDNVLSILGDTLRPGTAGAVATGLRFLRRHGLLLHERRQARRTCRTIEDMIVDARQVAGRKRTTPVADKFGMAGMTQFAIQGFLCKLSHPSHSELVSYRRGE